jgi:type II secretory pathway pseudopilin PulG
MPGAGLMPGAAAGQDLGETLLEILVAVAILGIAVVAVIGSLGIGIKTSDIHRQQATAGTTVRDYAEAVGTALAGNVAGSGGYTGCATAGAYATPPGYSPPSGYTASVVPGSLRYWSGGGWQTTCGTDTGLQRLTLQVTSSDGRAVEQLVLVLRKPCRLGDALCS